MSSPFRNGYSEMDSSLRLRASTRPLGNQLGITAAGRPPGGVSESPGAVDHSRRFADLAARSRRCPVGRSWSTAKSRSAVNGGLIGRAIPEDRARGYDRIRECGIVMDVKPRSSQIAAPFEWKWASYGAEPDLLPAAERVGGNDWTSIIEPRWTMTVCEPVGSGAPGAGGNTNFGSATGDWFGGSFRTMTGTPAGTSRTTTSMESQGMMAVPANRLVSKRR